MSSLSIIVRRVGLLASRRVPLIRSTALKACLSTRTVLVNDNKKKAVLHHDEAGDENPEMREFFDSMEGSVKKNIHVSHDKESANDMIDTMVNARRAYAVDAPDGISDGSIDEEIRQINAIIDDVALHKEDIKARLDKLNSMMPEAYAVDSPDGESDGHVKEELEEVKRIIDRASKHISHDKKAAQEMIDVMANGRKVFAVDAPDGTSDGTVAEEIRQINFIIDEVVLHKEEIKARLDNITAMMREAYAVDSPDGESDGHMKEELEEVKHIIDEAGKHVKNDKHNDTVKEALAKKRAADPEHW